MKRSKSLPENTAARTGWLLPYGTILLTLLASSLASISSPVWARQEIIRNPEIQRSEIRGTVQVRGCAPDASQIDLRAVPIEVRTDQRAPIRDGRARQMPARVVSTSDAHTFSFSITGLRPATIYQLTAFLSPDLCGRVFWRSEGRGLAVSGAEPVLIEGVAATTSLEVLQSSTNEWMSAEAVDFSDPSAATRSLRWRSTLADVVGGELQISASSFPLTGDFGACDEPESGLVYRQSVPAVQGEWAEIGSVDFSRILTRAVTPGDPASGDGIGTSALRLLLAGAPLYLRVVPVTSSGPACETTEHGAPGWVALAKVPTGLLEPPAPDPAPPILEPGSGHVYASPYFYRPSVYQPTKIFPSYDEKGYRVVKPHVLPSTKGCDYGTTAVLIQQGVPTSQIPVYADPVGCMLVKSQPWLSTITLHVGDRFVIRKTWSTGGGSSILDQFSPLLTGGTNALVLTLTALAELYNDAVSFVKGLTYDAILTLPGVGQLCDDYPEECKKAIAAGITYGMVAMGLPPTAPRWDQLKDEGLGYLSSLVGERFEEEVGVPSWLTEAAFDEARKQMTQGAIDEMTNDRGGVHPKYGWFMTDGGFEPAAWVVTVRKNGLDPVHVTLRRYETDLFGGADIELPQNFPRPLLPIIDPTNPRFLRIPMVLMPNLAGIPAPLCRVSWYTSPHEQCFGVLPPGSSPICQYQSNTDPNSPWKDNPECTKIHDHSYLVGIYYRDAWAAKAAGTSCTPLFAMTLAHFGVSLIPWPGLTFVVGADVPPLVSGTWSGPYIDACGGGS